jgi:hypothetical protein
MTTMAMKTKRNRRRKRLRKTQPWLRQNEMKAMMVMTINRKKKTIRKQPKLDIILKSQC